MTMRVIWAGEFAAPTGGDVTTRIAAVKARHAEIDVADVVAVYLDRQSVGLPAEPSTLAMAELALALRTDRQTLLMDGSDGMAKVWQPALLRATHHYVGHVEESDKQRLAALIAEHHCNSRISAAFASRIFDAIGKSESPIEARLGLHLATECDLEFDIDTQVSIQAADAKYRADFVIRVGRGIDLIVEADGHDFHERTKEQAARDKARDRAMLAAGYHVMRFTGSEIWRDPAKCAAEVAAFARSRQQ